jgi:hypothetical protein
MKQVIRDEYGCSISYDIEAGKSPLSGKQLTGGYPSESSGEKVVRFAEKHAGKDICVRISTRPDLAALVEEFYRVRAEIAEDNKRAAAARQAEQDAKDKPLLDAMWAEVEELKRQMPANHVLVTATKTGDSDGWPLMDYEACGVKLRSDEINHIGWASAIRPGALGAFEEVKVCSIDRDKLIQIKADREREDAEKAEKKAAREKELAETPVPECAIEAYNHYHGNADKAWESEDEASWALIFHWSPFIETQRGMHPLMAQEISSEAARESQITK